MGPHQVYMIFLLEDEHRLVGDAFFHLPCMAKPTTHVHMTSVMSLVISLGAQQRSMVMEITLVEKIQMELETGEFVKIQMHVQYRQGVSRLKSTRFYILPVQRCLKWRG